MIFLTNAKIALDSLKMTRSRTYLTMLGIIIGVSSITFILALGESIKHAVGEQVQNLDNNIIVVRPGQEQKGILNESGLLKYSPLAPYATTTLTEQDLKTITSQPEVKSAAALMLINGNVSANKKQAKSASILATNNDFANIMKLSPSEGQFFDEETNRDSVVIGSQLAIDLFGTNQALGQKVDIRGRDHTVIGVLKNNNGPLGINGININQSAIINLENGKTYNQGIAQVQQINVTLKNPDKQPEGVAAIHSGVLKNHAGQKDFTVLNSEDAANVSKSFYALTTSLTAIIASISLIVGGVGIMNIMLVGVAERTKEIGIRKSLGASNRHIRSQFLIEALMMSISGGVIGIIVAYALAAFAGLMLGFMPIISPLTIVIALALSVSVGVMFGLAPALRASRKDPIEALRQGS